VRFLQHFPANMSAPLSLPPPALSADALGAVLCALNGDVASLCAAACVARAWRDAALHPSLWRDFSTCFGDGDVAARLTDARLAALVARARGGLERLHLSSCAALTAFGVAAALRGCPPLTTLRVRGLLLGDSPDGTPWGAALDEARDALRAVVREPCAGLDVYNIACCSYTPRDFEEGGWCGRVCRGPNVTDEGEDGGSEDDDAYSAGDACPDCEDECDCWFCPTCTERATAAGVRPCQRVCGACSTAHHRFDDYSVRECSRCDRDICDACQAQRRCDGKCYIYGPQCAECTEEMLQTCSVCGKDGCNGLDDMCCFMGANLRSAQGAMQSSAGGAARTACGRRCGWSERGEAAMVPRRLRRRTSKRPSPTACRATWPECAARCSAPHARPLDCQLQWRRRLR
jgi:hypothetical protein